MVALLLQKPSQTSKFKDHSNALQRSILFWENEEIKS